MSDWKRYKWLMLLALLGSIVVVSGSLANAQLSYWRSLNPTRDGLLLCPIGSPPAPGPWSPPSNCAPFIHDVEFLNPTYAWAVGGTCDFHDKDTHASVQCNGDNPNNGLALYYDGFKWRNVLLPYGTPTLTSVSIVGQNDVWAVGINPNGIDNGVVLHWNGVAWQRVLVPAGVGPLYSVFMLPGGADGWAVGDEDGGGAPDVDVIRWSGTFPTGAWSPASIPTSPLLTGGALQSVHMTSPTFGWIVGDSVPGSFRIFKFDGAGWLGQPDPISAPLDLLSVYGISATDAWAVGEGDTIIHWNGASWTGPMVAPTTGIDYRSVWMVSATDGWIAGTESSLTSEGILLRWNGAAWSIQRSWVNVDLNTVFMLPGGVAGGSAGDAETIIRWTGTEWLAQTSPSFTTFNDLWMIASNDGWAVGDFGRIFRWDGRHWFHYETLPSRDNLYGLFFVSSTDGWAVGSTPTGTSPSGAFLGPTILRWNGVSWSVVTPPGVALNQELRDIWCLSSSQCWAVGTDSVVLKWDGVIWASVPSGLASTDDLLSVQMLSPTDGWAVGCDAAPNPGVCDDPKVTRWNGLAWSAVTVPPNPPAGLVGGLRSIHMLSPTNGWAVGDEPGDGDNTATITHWDGIQWRRVPGPDVGEDGFLAKVFMVSANDGWAVGKAIHHDSDRSIIVHWDGTTWDVISTPPIPPTLSMPLNSVYLVSSLDGWAVGGYEYQEFQPDGNSPGSDGIILRYGPDMVLLSTTVTVTSTVSTTTTEVHTTTTTPTTTTTAPPPEWRIPGFPIESILAGLVGGLVTLSILRRRRTTKR